MTKPSKTAPGRFKVIHCILPAGRAHGMLDRLREEKGIADVFFHHTRGGGISTRKGKESFRYLEREIATVLVPEDRADEIFKFIFFAAGLNQPHAGMVLMERTRLAMPMAITEETLGGE